MVIFRKKVILARVNFKVDFSKGKKNKKKSWRMFVLHVNQKWIDLIDTMQLALPKFSIYKLTKK